MKRFLSLILVLSLALSLIALPAMAEGEAFTIAVNLHGLDKSGGTANKIGPKHAEETTGIKINYYELDSASAGEKVNIMLASGDLPDAFLSIINETQVVSNLPLFVPLNEYLTEENAPNLMKMFEKYPELIDMITQVDGNIYTLGLEMPTTTEEFYEVCKDIKEGDPNGNGEADEIPVTFTQNNWAAHFINLLGPWGICEWEGGGDGYLKVEDGKAIFTATLPEFRAGLEYWHRMAAEGLLDVEGFTQTNEQLRPIEVLLRGQLSRLDPCLQFCRRTGCRVHRPARVAGFRLPGDPVCDPRRNQQVLRQLLRLCHHPRLQGSRSAGSLV